MKRLALSQSAQSRLWLLAALLLTALFSARTMWPALSPTNLQDDVLRHVFWMERFRDPSLFRNDLIADYYASVAPPGFVALYWTLSPLVDPLLLSKLLPTLLGLVLAVGLFKFVEALQPSPAAAFLATTLSSWYAWQYNDLPSATPRAFLLPLLALLLWALATARRRLVVGLAALLALFYPVGGALALALLATGLFSWRNGRPRWNPDRRDQLTFATATLLVLVFLLPDQLAGSRFGPVVTAQEARAMPEFSSAGIHPLFVDDPYVYWLYSNRTGFHLVVPDQLMRGLPIFFELAALASLLPLLMLLRPRWQRLTPAAGLLPRLLLASLGLYFLAHLLLFRLYLPSRYVMWSVPLVFAVAAGLALASLCRALARYLEPNRAGLLGALLVLALGLGLALYPAYYNGNFWSDPHPAVSAFLRSLPSDVRVAGASVDVDAVPAFAQRTVFASRWHTDPYHLGYYRELQRRLYALIDAYYATSAADLRAFLDREGIDVLLVNRGAFSPDTYRYAWRGNLFGRWEPYLSRAQSYVETGGPFVLVDLVRRCSVGLDGDVAILLTSCIRDAG
jgi:hypothetical protein